MKSRCVYLNKTRFLLSFKCFLAKNVLRYHQSLFQEYQLPINFHLIKSTKVTIKRFLSQASKLWEATQKLLNDRAASKSAS